VEKIVFISKNIKPTFYIYGDTLKIIYKNLEIFIIFGDGFGLFWDFDKLINHIISLSKYKSSFGY
jgi:hypothetical protein